jgi:hypothetical protein
MRRRELKVSLGGSLGPAAFCTKGHGSSEPPLCISSIDAVHIVPVSDTEWRDQPWRMAIRRTGRLLAPSTLVTNSTLPGRPPQPSWRMRAMMSRISMSPRAGSVRARAKDAEMSNSVDTFEPGAVRIWRAEPMHARKLENLLRWRQT